MAASHLRAWAGWAHRVCGWLGGGEGGGVLAQRLGEAGQGAAAARRVGTAFQTNDRCQTNPSATGEPFLRQSTGTA